MNAGEFILAAILLTSPKEPAVPAKHAAYLEALRPSLLTLAMDAEILDPREKGFVLATRFYGFAAEQAQTDLAGDLAMLQGRYQQLLRAPLVGEGERFPERKLINEYLAFNRAYRNQLTARLAIDLVYSEELRTAIAETDQLYQIYDCVRDAASPWYYITVRKQALLLLRDLIGPEDFYAGRLPPPIPIWHIPRDESPRPDHRMRRMPGRAENADNRRCTPR